PESESHKAVLRARPRRQRGRESQADGASEMTTWILALLMFAATDPITDEALRLEALRAVFPGMPVVAVAGKRIKVPKVNRETDPDALAGEQIYRVTGQPQDKTEQCAAESVIDLRLASTHEVAIRVYA